jgi:hypothetical protein
MGELPSANVMVDFHPAPHLAATMPEVWRRRGAIALTLLELP